MMLLFYGSLLENFIRRITVVLDSAFTNQIKTVLKNHLEVPQKDYFLSNDVTKISRKNVS